MSDETTPWTEAAKAYLDELMQHKPPLTYDAIADRMVSKFHRIFTKNSCISRARRSTVNKARAEGTGQYERKKKLRTKAAWHPALQPDTRTFDCRQITELDGHDCRWPINNGGPFLFCGRRVAESSPYCPNHTRAAYPAVGRH